MDWKDIGDAVKQYAPFLGQALTMSAPLTGPVGPIAGGLISAIAGAFGMDPEEAKNNPAALYQKIQMDPEAAVKLAQIESNERIEIQRVMAEIEKAYLADKQSARAADVEKTKVTGKRDVNMYVLAWMVVCGFFVLVGTMYFVVIPEKNVGPINQLMGALSTGFGVVLSYFFGSSKSSADKTSLLAGRGQ